MVILSISFTEWNDESCNVNIFEVFFGDPNRPLSVIDDAHCNVYWMTSVPA